MRRLHCLALLFVTACTTEPADPVATGTAGGKLDGPGASIVFGADWSEQVHGTLLAGTSVRIDYDLARLTTCRGESNGVQVWGVTGHAQFDGGAPITFEASRLQGGVVVPVVSDLPLPAAASHLALWFTINNEWGCLAYDSDYGKNYQFDLDRHGLGAVLSFNTDWSETQSGPIHAGDHLVLHYEPDRLRQCAGSQMGHPAWAVTAHYQVDGGAVHDVEASRPASEFLVAGDPEIVLTNGHDVAFWFEATSVWGCHAYDSSYGANYHFTIE